jgi:hypothetical protein
MADEETKEAEDREQSAEGKGAGGDEGASDQEQREQEDEEAKQEVKQLEEEGPPEALEDWPEGKAKYETFGGPEGEHGYHEGPEQQLGPSSLRHHEDGSVTIEGEEVDDPEEYKGEPIPGGPTDPDTPNLRMDKADAEDASTSDEQGEDRGEEDEEGSEQRAEDERSSGDEDED